MKFIQFVLLLTISNLLVAQPGSLDLSFGNDGSMITGFDNINAEAESIGIQSDGKIILSGNGSDESNFDVIAARYLPDGQLDTDFVDGGRFIFTDTDLDYQCYDMVVDGEDNIFLAGTVFTSTFSTRAFVIKLDKNGALDSSFDQDGVWYSETTDQSEDYRNILMQSDGKILIAGRSQIIGTGTTSIILRLNSDGSIDDTFGDKGLAVAAVPTGYNPRFLKLNSKDEIITGGFLLDTFVNIILLKFNTQGALDSSFGDGGVLVDENSFDEFGNNLAIQPDDKIIVCAGVTVFTRDFGMTRYNEDGSLDMTFGIVGRVSTDFSNMSNTSRSVLIQEDGHIILAGFTGGTPNHDYAIARYNSLGDLDFSFGVEGLVFTDLGFDDLIFTSVLQPDGKLLCAGNSIGSDDLSSFSVARYLTTMGTSIEEIEESLGEVNVYPNPSDGNFSISLELEYATTATINLLESNGRLVRELVPQVNFDEGMNTLDLSLDKSSGSSFLILEIKTEQGSIYRKLISTK